MAHNDNELPEKKDQKPGLRVSPITGGVLALVAIAVAVGVGLIVHFVEKGKEVTCVCSPAIPGESGLHGDAALEGCKALARDPMSEICGLCKAAKPKEDVIFLPKTVKPIFYDLEMRPNMYEGDPSAFTFNGHVKITIECLQPSNDVILHANKLDITSGSVQFGVDDNNSDDVKYVSHELDSGNQLLKIHLNKNMIKNRVYYVKMNFTGPLKDDLVGFYLSSYKRGDTTVYLATTQFESTDARKAFPCFDEPELKAHFNITLVRRQDLSTISNMKLQRTENREPGFVADIYPTTPIMSTYLVAFVVSDFQYLSNTTRRGLEYRIWAQNESLNALQYAMSVGTRTISFYEDYFNISFPLPKQDMVAIPDFGPGAMENWGCITYRAIRLFYTDGVTSSSAKQSVLVDITHELAHQWFGDLVTMKWWDDLWLNEGFATFFEYFGADHIEPDWDMYNQFVAEEIIPVFETDGIVTSHPVYVDVKKPDEVEQIFDDISYNKGGSVLRMLKFFLGDGTFQRGLTRYLRSRAYSNADHDDLWAALEAQAKEEKKDVPVADTMKTWTLQMNYPVVSVSRAGSSQLQLKQGRFLLDPSAADPGTYPSPFQYKWNVPFTFTTSSQKNFNVTDADIVWVMRNAESDVYPTNVNIPDTSDGSSWILGNVQHHGFYRVNYDVDNWNNIIKQLKRDHTAIIPINRAQIINDAIDLARSGLLDQRVALGTLEYLSAEVSYYPWAVALAKLDYMDAMLRDTEVYGAFQGFLRASSTAAFQHYGFEDSGANHIQSIAQRVIVNAACSSSNPACRQRATEIFQAWKENPHANRINPDLLKTILCTGVSDGNADDWNVLYDRYQAETSLSVKDDMLMALACSKEPWVIDTYLKRTITAGEIPKADTTRVLNFSPNLNGKTQPFVWNFLRQHYNLLRDDYSASFYYFAKMILSATGTFNTEFHLKELEAFVNSTADLGIGVTAFTQAISQTKANIKWMKKNYPIIKQWLTDLGYYKDHNQKEQRTTSEDIFLPTNVKPLSYDLEMKPNMYEGDPASFTFEGSVTIHIRCLQPTSDVTLHINKLNITSGSIEFGPDVGGVPAVRYVSHEQNKGNQFLTIHVNEELKKDGLYHLKMNFTGPLRDDLAGFYLSSYKNGNTSVYLATTQFESSDARKAFPCFDEPALKATFNIVLVRKKGFSSTSNMPINRTEDRQGGYQADIYQTTPLMSTYLVAFVVSDFGFINGTTSRGLQYRVWARKNALSQLDYALQVGTKVISHYETYFNHTFPLPKQDMIAIPDFAMGAMENWGMITYRESLLLYKDGVTNNYAKQQVLVAIAHELAHQWFGNLVTPKWWDDLWLNEGFATFVEYMGSDLVEPQFNMFEQFVVEEMFPLFTEDGLVTSHPVYVDVKTVDEINEIFDDISYNKGGTVLRMLRFFIGESTFQKGLSRYLENRKYSNADHNDLWAALDYQAKSEKKTVDVVDTMKTWTLQMNYPVVSVSRAGSSQLQLKQNRFLLDPSAADPGTYPSPFHYKWDIPFTFTTSLERSFSKTDADIIWIKREDKSDKYTTSLSIPASDQTSWIIGNIGLYGLYRVQYEDSNWRALIHQLKTDHTVIDRTNRAQIINDAWDLARSGLLKQDIALQTVEYLSRESDYYPWTAARGKLAYVDTMLQNTEMYGRFKTFMRNITATPFSKVGLNDTGASQLESFARREIVGAACDASSRKCITQVTSLFKKWKENSPLYPLYPEMRKTILCTGVAEGGAEDWFEVYRRYQAEPEIAIKGDLQYALTCTRTEWIIHTLLERAITPSEVSRSDTTRIMFYVSNSARGQPIVWNFIKANWPLLRDEFSATFNYVAKMITGSTRGFNTQQQLQEIEDFMRSTPNLGTGERAFHQAVEQTKANIKWMNKNYPGVKRWLEEMPL
ncbi:uncharacterized protein LOC124113176 isoform X1 [Haliotis rufescens]|uniref:uncharacterized protein LOC124113176 isoform X1 n=1 Tax=Haliotis rufescens TaxID=6454 RepID=UPI00201EBC18|nr:uncharacterized protein LOC124113176 isoform X1 [Haliotis rufescens]